MKTPSKSNQVSGLVALSVLCGAALHSESAEAAVYTYVDKDGTRWLTNTPKKGNKYKLVSKYGAPQKSAPTSKNVAKGVANTSGYNANIPVVKAASRGHCGTQNASQLERKMLPYLDSIRTHARTYGVDEKQVIAIMHQESCFNPKARTRVGAMGLMQLMPGTADMLGVNNAWDPHQNIRGGVKYLAEQLRTFNGNEALALAAYNAGPGAVRKYKGIPPFKETQGYVAKIMRDYRGTQASPIRQAQVAPQAVGYQRSAQIPAGISRGQGWAKPVQDFTVFRGLS